MKVARGFRNTISKGRTLTFLAASLTFLSGVICTGPVNDPCQFDSLECQANLHDFALDPDCELSGDLEVIVGQGDESYSEMGIDETPDAYFGPQGGQHISFGFRVENPALDRYDRLLVRFGFYHECETGEECWSPMDGYIVCSGSDIDESSGNCVIEATERTAVFGSVQELRVVPGGAVEEFGLVIIPNSWPIVGGSGVMRVSVLDPCGQSGSAEHRFRSDANPGVDSGVLP